MRNGKTTARDPAAGQLAALLEERTGVEFGVSGRLVTIGREEAERLLLVLDFLEDGAKERAAALPGYAAPPSLAKGQRFTARGLVWEALADSEGGSVRASLLGVGGEVPMPLREVTQS